MEVHEFDLASGAHPGVCLNIPIWMVVVCPPLAIGARRAWQRADDALEFGERHLEGDQLDRFEVLAQRVVLAHGTTACQVESP